MIVLIDLELPCLRSSRLTTKCFWRIGYLHGYGQGYGYGQGQGHGHGHVHGHGHGSLTDRPISNV